MLIILSPSKTIKIHGTDKSPLVSQAVFLPQSSKLVRNLKKYSFEALQELLNTSHQLTQTTQDYYQLWNRQHTQQKSCQAILSFRGEAYSGLQAEEMSDSTLLYAQQHLVILSGLYGALRPLDLIQPYRLDVADSFIIDDHNLYHFWKNRVTHWVKKQMEEQGDDILINLASQEYFRMLDQKKLKGRIVTPIFKDKIGAEYKIVSVFAKQSRGKMARFMLENEITKAEELKSFEESGYYYNENLSNADQYVFTRG